MSEESERVNPWEALRRELEAKRRRDMQHTLVGGAVGFVTFALLVWVAVLTDLWTMPEASLMFTVIGPIFVLGGVVTAHSIANARR